MKSSLNIRLNWKPQIQRIFRHIVLLLQVKLTDGLWRYGRTSEREILTKIRTLLPIERNYLAEERTALAEFRTGLTLALVSSCNQSRNLCFSKCRLRCGK